MPAPNAELRAKKAEDWTTVEKLGGMRHSQATRGTRVSIAGAVVARHARHCAAAMQFLEHQASGSVQRRFADGNNACPVVSGAPPDEALE